MKSTRSSVTTKITQESGFAHRWKVISNLMLCLRRKQSWQLNDIFMFFLLFLCAFWYKILQAMRQMFFVELRSWNLNYMMTFINDVAQPEEGGPQYCDARCKCVSKTAFLVWQSRERVRKSQMRITSFMNDPLWNVQWLVQTLYFMCDDCKYWWIGSSLEFWWCALERDELES